MTRLHNKKMRYLIVSAVALSALVGTVAYAVLSKQMTITGSISKKGGIWDIYLSSAEVLETTGTATSETLEFINDNKTLNIAPSLSQPGDSITYTFDVNNGSSTIKAELVKWYFVNASEFNAIASQYDISATLVYEDGSALSPGVDVLLPETSKTLKLTFEYNGTEAITTDDVFIPVQIELQYVQTDKNPVTS